MRPVVSRVEVLDDTACTDLRRLLDADPLVNAVLAARLDAMNTLSAAAFGGPVLGVRGRGGALTAALHIGGNLTPVAGDPASWRMLGHHLRSQPRSSTSIVGAQEAVHCLWSVLRDGWGPARAVREHQPLLVLDRADALPLGDERVRAVRVAELDHYLPAAAAMFTEELDASPFAFGERGYRRRIGALIDADRAFAIFDSDGSVLFKADLGALSRHTCQVQGVWVRPDLRGTGLGTAALVPVLRHALTRAPTASLYVNDYNTAARRMYARLGMREVATLSTVLF